MSVNLNTCKPGDKLIRRDGYVMTYVRRSEDVRHVLEYEDGNYAKWTTNGGFASDDKDELDSDIVSIQHSTRRKLVRFKVFCVGCDWWADGRVNGFSFANYYSRRSDAIRGAKRFCKAIGHECVIDVEVKK